MTRASGSVVETRATAILGAALLLGGNRLRELLQRLLKSRDSVLGGALPRGVPSSAELGVASFPGDRLQVRTGGLHELLERGPAAERAGTGTGANARAVLCDAVKLDERVLHEEREHLSHEVIEETTALDAELREAAVLDGHTATEPAIGIVAQTEVGKLARAADALAGGVDPEPELQPGVFGPCSWPTMMRAYENVEGLEIEFLDDRIDRAHRMIERHSVFEGARPPFELGAGARAQACGGPRARPLGPVGHGRGTSSRPIRPPPRIQPAERSQLWAAVRGGSPSRTRGRGRRSLQPSK